MVGTSRRLLLAAALVVLGLPAQTSAVQRNAGARDVNSYLKNSVRTDVGGEGLWLPQLDGKLTEWLPPRPGFVGPVYYVHATSLPGLFDYEFQSEQGARLTARATAHEWTPAYTRTRYALVDATGEAVAALEETKLITDSEEALSEIEIHNQAEHKLRLHIRIVDLLDERPAEGASFHPLRTPKRIAFNPTTYYFTGLRISKYYLIRADSFTGTVELEAGKRARFSTKAVFGNTASDCTRKLRRLTNTVALRDRVAAFNRWFADNVPPFKCSDPDFEKMYYYRWYLVKKCSINARKFVPDHPYPVPVMYEGVAGRWFTKVIGLPLPMQILEARWLNDKSLAKGQARTALTKPDFFDYLNWTPWAIWQLHLVSPDPKLIKDSHPAMRRFVASQETKDEDEDWLPTVWGSWITGMEYQPSFHYFTDPRWDHKLADEFITNDHLTKDPAVYRKYLALERVDEATYYLLNTLAVARASRVARDRTGEREYESRAASIRRAIAERMWEAQTRFFYDIHPVTHEKAIEAKTIDGFFPFIFGALAGTDHIRLFDHLLDPNEFWTDWPTPTVSQDSPAFDSRGYWKVGPNASAEKPYYYVDSWNGPTWIFSNALVLEALACAARMTRDASLVDAFNILMKKHTELQFLGRDRNVPCTVEHYDSKTGQNIRLLADYFHSFYNDLIIRHMTGIVPREDDLIEIDPLVQGWERFSIRGVRYREYRISISFDGRFRVAIDGKSVFSSPSITRFVYDPRKGSVVSTSLQR